MKETDILKLKKPDRADNVLIGVLNENSDTIDSAIGQVRDGFEGTDKAFKEHVADYVKHPGYAHTTGTNTYSVKLTPAPTKLVDGLGIVIRVGSTATGKCRLNVNSLGAKDIRTPDGEDVDDLVSGGVYTVRYNGSAFILQGEGGGKGVDTLEVYNWLTTTAPFKDDGYHFYNSQNNTITVNGGNGFPNGKRVFDTNGNLIASIMNSTGFKWTITPDYILKYNLRRVIAIDMKGNELFNVAHTGWGDMVGLSMTNKSLVSMGRDGNDTMKISVCDLNGNMVHEYNVRAVGIRFDLSLKMESVLAMDSGDMYVQWGFSSSGTIVSDYYSNGSIGPVVRVSVKDNYRTATIYKGQTPTII